MGWEGEQISTAGHVVIAGVGARRRGAAKTRRSRNRCPSISPSKYGEVELVRVTSRASGNSLKSLWQPPQRVFAPASAVAATQGSLPYPTHPFIHVIGITAQVYVFDGDPPTNKSGELARRKALRTVKVTEKHNEDVKELLKYVRPSVRTSSLVCHFPARLRFQTQHVKLCIGNRCRIPYSDVSSTN
eukprot:GHVU01165701.1.p1 GENE.GHVU01165701.1~~GHVU01165701.1.p1  ORF type:complete len:187 (-),score=7.76 GHVU01165701.1:285-845(-)